MAFTVTVTQVDQQTYASVSRAVRGSEVTNLRPSTEGNLSSAAIFEKWSGTAWQTWYVSQTYASVLSSMTADEAESGAELQSNKVTSISGSSTDVEYPSAKLVYDQLALKAPLASPTFTGTAAAPTAASGTNTTQLATTAFVQNKKAVSGTAAGTDAYTVTFAPVVTPAAGSLVMVRFTNANTGAATLNGTAIVRKDGSTALSANDILAASWYQLYHDGTSYVLLGSA